MASYGGPEVLELADIDTPEIGEDQLLVQVHASSVNPVDWKVRRGEARLFSGLLRPPAVLGADFAGEVRRVGRAVTQHAVGERVFGMVPAFRGGAYAEFVRVTPDNIAVMPDNVSYEQAAALPLTALTALQVLDRAGDARARPRMVVNGCSGGLGHLVVQMAKARGFDVTGVCGTRNVELARSLGADHVIDYTATPALEGFAQCDVFVDAVANQSFSAVRRKLSRDGVYVTAMPSFRAMVLAPLANGLRHQKHLYVWVKPHREALAEVADMVERDLVAPVIHRQYPLEQIREAHRESERGHVAGKISLRL